MENALETLFNRLSILTSLSFGPELYVAEVYDLKIILGDANRPDKSLPETLINY